MASTQDSSQANWRRFRSPTDSFAQPSTSAWQRIVGRGAKSGMQRGRRHLTEDSELAAPRGRLEPATFPASRAALTRLGMEGTSGLQPVTSSVSRKRSNQLSYAPTGACGGTEQLLL